MKVRVFLISYAFISLALFPLIGTTSFGISAPVSFILAAEVGGKSVGETLALCLLSLLFPPKFKYSHVYLLEPRKDLLEIVSSMPFRGVLVVRIEEARMVHPSPFPPQVQKVYLYSKEEVSGWLRSRGISFSFPSS